MGSNASSDSCPKDMELCCWRDALICLNQSGLSICLSACLSVMNELLDPRRGGSYLIGLSEGVIRSNMADAAPYTELLPAQFTAQSMAGLSPEQRGATASYLST